MTSKRHKPSIDRSSLQEQLRNDYPELLVFQDEDVIYVRGSFPLHFEGKVLDRYQIELTIPPFFPDEEPILKEIGGRIPRKFERHINGEGTACWQVPEEWLILALEEKTVLKFLEGPVRNYFLSQTAFELTGEWPLGERTHFRKGLIESYKELLGVEDEVAVREYLKLLSKKKIKGHWLCPCGSQLIIRRCHLKEIRDLQQRIKPQLARKALKRLEDQMY